MNPDSIGYILRAPNGTFIPLRSCKQIPLVLSFSIPLGLYGHIALLSNQTSTSHIDISADIINPTMSTEASFLLINDEQRQHSINKGYPIAQIIFERAATPTIHILSRL